MAEADKYWEDGQYLEAMGAYQAVLEASADADQKAKALLRTGDIYSYFLNDHARALVQYEALIKRYPESPHAANAYFNSGMILYEKDRHQEALQRFKDYLSRYPKGDRKDTAEFMMESCTRPSPPAVEKKAAAIPAADAIRVRLKSGVRSVRVNSVVLDITGSGGEPVSSGEKAATISAVGQGLVLNGGSRVFDELLIVPAGEGALTLDGIKYRGKIRIRRNLAGGMDATNVLPLEAYLYGVLPKEMSPRWFLEALKAQAVAARTYALYQIDKSKNRDYDVLSTTASQMYGGATVETKQSNRAVDETKGTVLVYNGQLILAYFHANSGGVTEDAQRVWSAEIPYLKSIRDDYSLRAPIGGWKRTVNLEDIRTALNKNKCDIGPIEKIVADDSSPSGRITKIRITHAGKETVMSGNDFRLKTDPTLIKSTFFTIACDDRTAVFDGKGSGHGVGLSQWGAYVMAREGRTYRDILKFYYPGTELRLP